MAVKDHPEHHHYPGPPEELIVETSFATAIRRTIDDLFTRQDIAEKLQETQEDEEVESFVEGWKQSLTLHLEETAEVAVENFLTDFDRFQAAREPTSSPLPQQRTDIDNRVDVIR